MPGRTSVALITLFVALVAGTGAVLLGFAGGGSQSRDLAVTVEESEIVLNDSPAIPENTTGGGVQRCTQVGPPPNSYSVQTSLLLRGQNGTVPPDRYRVEIAVPSIPKTLDRNVTESSVRPVRVWSVFTHEGELEVGENRTVEIRGRKDGRTLATTNETVTVEAGGRTVDCEDV